MHEPCTCLAIFYTLQQIYPPTEAEILEGPVGFVYYDDDENGEPFFEMQDSRGDTFADGGFLRVSARGQLIDGFAEIRLLENEVE